MNEQLITITFQYIRELIVLIATCAVVVPIIRGAIIGLVELLAQVILNSRRGR